MGSEKQRQKGGASYVGGFFQFFDWNAKSRKKLFTKKSDLPEKLKQGKIKNAHFSTRPVLVVEEDEFREGMCMKVRTEEDGCGTKAPGVVARLMGLDSLPAHNLNDPSATPPFDSRSLDDAFFHGNNLDFDLDTYSLNSSATLPERLDRFPLPAARPNPRKLPKASIKKFQMEVLPPKSAKSVPAAHHKIMSPVKSRPRKNAADIMEAAARIIEHGSRHTKAGPKPSSVGASTPRRSAESGAAKQLKGQPLAKSWNGPPDTASMRVRVDVGGTSSGPVKDKDRSVSLAIQAKVNVQRREGLGPGAGRDPPAGEKVEVRVIQSFGVLPAGESGHPRKTADNSSVLRPNSRKQNTVVPVKAKPKLVKSREGNPGSLESFAAPPPANRCAAPAKAVGTRDANDGGSDCCERSRGKAGLRRRRSVVGEGVRPGPNEGREGRAEEGKNGTDVVSFTFTAPMARGGRRRSAEPSERRTGPCQKIHEFDMKLCSLGFNVMTGDALGVLLEKKLNRLTRAAAAEPWSGRSDAGRVLPDKRDRSGLFEVEIDGCFGYGSSPGPAQGTGKKHKHQEEEGEDDPIPVRLPAESCDSSDTVDDARSRPGETDPSSSVMGQEPAGTEGPNLTVGGARADLSDSAISKSSPAECSMEWEKEYVEEIVSCVMPWGEAGAVFLTGGSLFEQLEGRNGRGGDGFEQRMRRKVVFECVAESLERRWRGPRGGPERERGVAEQVYGEICRWRGQRDCMVDELVGLDMSGGRGRWLDFEDDILEIVKGVEGDLLHSLLDDVVGNMAGVGA